MKITLPKELRGYQFSRLVEVELNDFDVERVLPSLFFLVITRGCERGGRKNQATNYDLYLNRLLQHGRLKGFDAPHARRMLDRWVRSAIVQMGGVGRSRKGQQIEYAVPHTLLSYTTGLPSEIRRQRGVHAFLYRLLCHLPLAKTQAEVRAAIHEIFIRCFGRGVRVGPPPDYKGEYDGTESIDVQALLSICYLEGFTPTPAGRNRIEAMGDFTLPIPARRLAEDMILYLLAYGQRLPTFALIRGFLALINFGLFVYSLKLIHAINGLVRASPADDGRRPLPEAMQADFDGTSAPEIYSDFTRQRGTVSDELAKACVERDLEAIRQFLESSLLLRTLDRYAASLQLTETRSQSTPEYLRQLLEFQDHIDFQAEARAEIRRIKSQAENAANNEVMEQLEQLSALHGPTERAVTALVALLAESQHKSAVNAYLMWYRCAGGLSRSYGILSGNSTGRRNWRYAMSDELLATLVRVAMIETPTGDFNSVSVRSSLRLHDFLAFLETRYGLIVHRPPTFLDDLGTRAAAHRNFEAFKRRLRQMGYFQALSDDFNTQNLEMPTECAEVDA